MKALVVYDSVYGNTEKIARSIGEAIAPSSEVRVLRVGEASPADLASVDLLIVGSPTHGGRPTLAVQELLERVSTAALKGIKVAAFDTRLSAKLVGIFGFAAGRIARDLKGRGATLARPPDGFFVKGREGPLEEGELERAAEWARGTLESKK